MNITLRDFLNLKEDGTMNYNIEDMEKGGWTEYPSIGAQYHQTTAGNKLYTKFVNKDGREVVFDRYGNMITDYPDKGIFNYRDGFTQGNEHTLYDVRPYNKLMY